MEKWERTCKQFYVSKNIHKVILIIFLVSICFSFGMKLFEASDQIGEIDQAQKITQ